MVERLRYFERIASSLANPEVRAWKKAGGRVVGTVCSNIPEEVLHAASLLPLRIRAIDLEDTANADSQLHRINCSYTRSVLELALRGKLAFLDGLVTANSCDHMLRLAGGLRAEGRMPWIHDFSMHHAMVGSARGWLVQEMHRLIRRIKSGFGVEPSEGDLERSISLHNRIRAGMAELNDLRKEDPPLLSGTEFLHVALTGMSIPRERFDAKLQDLISALRNRRVPKRDGPRLMVIGGGCDAPGFIEFIEQTGARVVIDGLCFGTRHFDQTLPKNDGEPLRAIATRYIRRAGCPSIMNGFEQSRGFILRLVRDWGVQGIICARLKFCDHWAGFRKLLSAALRPEGIPVLELEREYGTTGSGQIRTRIQAFVEMLGP